MIRLGALSLLLSCFFALAICLFRSPGEQNIPLNASLFTTGDCEQPCWHGIQPGKTTLDEAEGILRADTSFVTEVGRENPLVQCSLYWTILSQPKFYGCIQSDKANMITSVWLEANWMHDGVSLYDTLPILGSPTKVLVCSAADGMPMLMYFGRNVEVDAWNVDAGAISFPTSDDFDPIVWYVSYTQPGTKATNRPDTDMLDWQGFTNLQAKYYRGNC